MLNQINMELPAWLKIGNAIGKLNISGWFKGWFVKNEFHQTINVIVNLPVLNEPTIAKSDGNVSSKMSDDPKGVKLTDENILLISKINLVHKINNRGDYDFKGDFVWALYYIQYKPDSSWPCNAAVRIAQSMQDINFFHAFEVIEDPEEKSKFENLKKKINYLYDRIIQELRHTNKRGQIEKQFTTPYHTVLEKKPDLNNIKYAEIFKEFQSLLIELFNKYRLKNE
ncbi:MAG: hypothetical protein UU18_C0007G0023 [Parcubacteria group bacterium GW2011_GWB2_40_8]|uniref:Uncharacterized protein n=1 Tax=Candidatus Nomurabacteria bacterium GW2011_GWD2_39_12 TaxID=1618759 RepID=A0A837HPQ1_9BACT|nr:MAG: hypothetical protein UT27_C0019G0002 [Candidatus Nomurabacteria bacterium GW2011_GWD2_39_12]KKR38245.1 MAG: hypothetical protein UT71_C0011G0022 [Parcubacteria group bacterium GW2011_GWF2_40_10]KKR46404.1 MAG: hypothetical protein UT83_C0024G0002 [Parcubacteria group bacterium GW2011_GWA2_40_143]KKR75384.1 MAG: hypothetical protein UU18_C0007G0023 [Parcubacteria group bacterium GW2011_GWB2_40_8]KKR76929.1 MAG: hypothetical protein UU20_C0017G0005 [Parcubacteria group bacterium GW2011_GW